MSFSNTKQIALRPIRAQCHDMCGYSSARNQATSALNQATGLAAQACALVPVLTEGKKER